MRYEAPGSTFTPRVDGYDTGLAGTIGVRILDSTGATVTARTTAGIIESPAGSGSYLATLTAPTGVGEYTIGWDDGTIGPGSFRGEQLVVTVNTVVPVVPVDLYITAAAVKESLVLNGTTFADDDINRAVYAAVGAVDQLFGRKFSQDTDPTDRYYPVHRRSLQVIEIYDLTAATTPAVTVDADGDGTFETTLTVDTDFVFEPLNAAADGIPYERVAMLGGRILPPGRRRVKVTGTHGWPTGSVPAQVAAFAEVLAIKWVTRFRDAPFGFVTAGADMAVAMRLAKMDPDFPALSAGLTKGAMIA